MLESNYVNGRVFRKISVYFLNKSISKFISKWNFLKINLQLALNLEKIKYFAFSVTSS